MKTALQLLSSALRSIRMRISPAFHARATAAYWSSVVKTHADMSEESFDFYAAHIATLLGPPEQAGRVLDHGAGDGKIGMRLRKLGYNVEFSEFATQFIASIRAAGFTCHHVDECPLGRFDTIFVNNAVFYVHPSKLLRQIQWLLDRTGSKGSLFLLDVPTSQRSHFLVGGALKRLVWRLTGVYQPDAGGFFVDENRVSRHFNNVKVQQGWCDYRCHLIIHKS